MTNLLFLQKIRNAMKSRHLLFVVMWSTVSLFAQSFNGIHRPQAPIARQAFLAEPVKPVAPTGEEVRPVSPVRQSMGTQPGVRETIIGTTTYDLQTNATMARRVVRWADGKEAAAWTLSLQFSPSYSDRGAGYNYHDGTSWQPEPTARIEPYRNGWPTIGTYEQGGTTYEYVLSHMLDPSNGYYGGFFFSTRARGASSWNTTEVFHKDDIGDTLLWPVTASSGDYIYVVCNNREGVVNGVLRPVLFSRYQISTSQWIDSFIALPGYDSSQYYSGGGDEYNIDARDSIVAVVIGGLGTHLTLWKSTDWGNTWTKKFVDRFPIDAYNDKTLLTDTPWTNDGSVSVVIDGNGTAHVAWGMTRSVNLDTTDGGISFFPGIGLIGYWNETMPEDTTGTMDSFMVIASIYDRHNDDVITITSASIQSGSNGGARYTNTSACSHVNLAIDDQGKLFAVYDCLIDSVLSIDGINYRDVYVVYSTDQGATWSWPPANISGDYISEDVFGFVARHVDDSLHITFQEDATPGNAVQGSHGITLNSIIHAHVSKADLLAGNISPEAFEPGVGIGQTAITGRLSVYPNPATQDAAFSLPSGSGPAMEITAYDAVGRVVYRNPRPTSPYVIDVSRWTPGLYTVRVQTPAGTYLGRLNVIR